jgi:replication-associated recombination protein RarA
MTHYQTKNGFNDDEVISVLQKDIRRGKEDDAMFWALELAEAGKPSFGTLCSRLQVILYEDIGLGEPGTVLRASKAIDDMKSMYDNNRGDYVMTLSYIILLMCRAKKSRITDHFKEYITFRRESGTADMKIPDYALDMHTTRGNEMGRKKNTLAGVDHFIKEGEVLDNENPDIENIYTDEVHKIWRLHKK